uniref:Transmembrane protein 145 n=1 Tax=Mesocestoides corti TaxID=53468 RepID=A0A5K3EPA6_MESCO
IFICSLIGAFGLYFVTGATVNYAFKGHRGVNVIPNVAVWRGCIHFFSDCCRRICHPHLYRRAERLPSGYVEFHMPSGSLLSPDLEEADNPPASSLLSQSQECERSDFPIGGEATEEDDDDLLVM